MIDVRKYPHHTTQVADGYQASFPDFPGIVVVAETAEEAYSGALKELIALLEALESHQTVLHAPKIRL